MCCEARSSRVVTVKWILIEIRRFEYGQKIYILWKRIRVQVSHIMSLLIFADRKEEFYRYE